jgi:outer membrane autotransporter protein
LRDSYGADGRQNGSGAGLSAEVGQPLPLGASGWVLEPQAQLRYHHARYRGFSDVLSNIDARNDNVLQGRIGGRLYASPAAASRQGPQAWLTANLFHDFSGATPDATVGGTVVGERLARSWAEIGAGFQLPVAQGAVVYARLAHQKSVGGGGERKGLAGNAGLRASW